MVSVTEELGFSSYLVSINFDLDSHMWLGLRQELVQVWRRITQGFGAGREGVADKNNRQLLKAYNVLVALRVSLSEPPRQP